MGCFKFKQIENINLNIKMEEKNNNKTENSNENKKSEVGNYAFKFPLENSFSKVEIPFAFQSNIDENSNNNKFHSYIKIQETPTLYLDISNDEKVDKLFLSSTIENLKSDNQQKEKQISSLETSITETKAENESIKAEIARLHEEIMLRSGKIKTLTQTIKENEEIHNKQINEMSLKVNEKTKMLKGLKENYEKIKNELKKNSNSLTDSLLDSAHEQLQKLTIEYVNTPDFFSNKFTCESYNDEYIQQSLQLDLLDFQSYVKEQIIKVKPKLNELIDLIQKAVDGSIGSNYIVKLYGSHATNLCLPWSDLDVVIVNKEKDFVNSYVPLHELFKYLQEKNYFLTINFIGTATVPLIKIHTKENYGLMSVDISLQDNKHYGIQCVTLVTSLIEKYDVLTPMVLALKNILKKANLNDPYKVSINNIIIRGDLVPMG